MTPGDEADLDGVQLDDVLHVSEHEAGGVQHEQRLNRREEVEREKRHRAAAQLQQQQEEDVSIDCKMSLLGKSTVWLQPKIFFVHGISARMSHAPPQLSCHVQSYPVWGACKGNT